MTEWSYFVTGQPPSVNHLYSRRRGGGIYKAEGVERYQTLVVYETKLARPKEWEPAPQIRIFYDFLLWRKADADNLKKALNDAIAIALGVNDDCFLDCTRSKVSGVKKAEAGVTVTVSNVA